MTTQNSPLDPVCYKCRTVYTLSDLKKLEEEGRKKKLIEDSLIPGCTCTNKYVVCPKCVEDPIKWIEGDKFRRAKDWTIDDKPPLLFVGYSKCMRCLCY